jgi:hypothetical protein
MGGPLVIDSVGPEGVQMKCRLPSASGSGQPFGITVQLGGPRQSLPICPLAEVADEGGGRLPVEPSSGLLSTAISQCKV